MTPDAFFSALLPAIGWSLLHFLWQGLLIGCGASLALHLLRNARPQARYAVACAALVLCVLLPLAGIVLRMVEAATLPLPVAADGNWLAAAGAPAVPELMDADQWTSWRYLLQRQLPWLVLLWAAGAAVMTLRLSMGLLWVRERTLQAADVPDAAWQQRLDRLALRMGLKRDVRLALAERLEGPMTAGCWKPVVLVPASLVTGMPPELLEALLAHELAHIRRHDYLINLAQSAIEILLFYHPAVWMLSNHIRTEREQIADDIAASTLGEPRRLALALSELDRFQFSTPQLAHAAHGGNLMSRIKRLVRPGSEPLSWKIAAPLLGLCTACAMLYAHAAPSADTVRGRMTVTAEDNSANDANKVNDANRANDANRLNDANDANNGGSVAAQESLAGGEELVEVAPAPPAPPAAPAFAAPAAPAAPEAPPAPPAAPAAPAARALPAMPAVPAVPEMAELPDVPAVPGNIPHPPKPPKPPKVPRIDLGGESFRHLHISDKNRDTYAVVQGKRNISLSGTEGDIDELKRLKGSVKGDFIWYRSGGKSYLIQDPALLAKANAAWAPTEKLGEQLDAHGKVMDQHSKVMDGLSAKMDALNAQREGSQAERDARRAAERKVEQLARQQEAIGRQIEAQARKLEHERADGQRDAGRQQMEALQAKMEPLTQQMAQAAQELAKNHAQMASQAAPMKELGREMAEASKPMRELGRKMGELGREQARISREADKIVRGLIEEAVRNGQAKPML